jgi:hypothetical protein
MGNQIAEESGYYAEDYQDPEELEYLEDDLDDEDIEAFGEDLDDDESIAVEDDDDEDIEAYDEDVDDDESYTFEDYDEDEGSEDDDDETFDEGYDYSGEADEAFAAERRRRRGVRARQLAKIRADMMRKRALIARMKARSAARKAQKQLYGKLKAIRRHPRVPLPRISIARGTGYVTAILPNGRRTKMMFKPSLATRTDVNRLTRQISAVGVKQARAIRVQDKNIKLLKSAQTTAVKSLTAQQLKSTKLLTKQITDGDKNLDKRITKLVSNQKKTGHKQDVKMLGQIRQQQKRSTWNTALVASAIPLFAAYGDRAIGDNANPITAKNAFIAGSTVFFLFADDLLNHFMKRGGKKWRTGASIWNIAAPFANWGVVWLFMKNRQHHRFITGLTDVTGSAESPAIAIPVAKNNDMAANPPVVASLITATDAVVGVKARIDQGNLYLTLIGDSLTGASHASVAWQVDTMDPKYQRTSSSASS